MLLFLFPIFLYLWSQKKNVKKYISTSKYIKKYISQNTSFVCVLYFEEEKSQNNYKVSFTKLICVKKEEESYKKRKKEEETTCTQLYIHTNKSGNKGE